MAKNWWKWPEQKLDALIQYTKTIKIKEKVNQIIKEGKFTKKNTTKK